MGTPWSLAKICPGDNFINILRTPFLYESTLRSFSLVMKLITGLKPNAKCQVNLDDIPETSETHMGKYYQNRKICREKVKTYFQQQSILTVSLSLSLSVFLSLERDK